MTFQRTAHIFEDQRPLTGPWFLWDKGQGRLTGSFSPVAGASILAFVDPSRGIVDLDPDYLKTQTRYPGLSNFNGNNRSKDSWTIPYGSSKLSGSPRLVRNIFKTLLKSNALSEDWKIENSPEYRGQSVGDVLRENRPDPVDEISSKSVGSVILYHGTSAKRWDTIKVKGLKPGSPTGFGEDPYIDQVKGYSDRNIYLSSSIPEAEKYATRAAIVDRSKAVVLAVTVNDFTRFLLDEDTAGVLELDGWRYQFSGDAYQIQEDGRVSIKKWRLGPNASYIQDLFQRNTLLGLRKGKTIAYRGAIRPSNLKVVEIYKPVKIKNDPKYHHTTADSESFAEGMRKVRENMTYPKKASVTGFPEFEIGRVKFILMVDRPDLVPSYVTYFTRAYRVIKNGGFDKFWYGLVFLSPDLETLSEVKIRSYEASGYKRHFVEHRAGYYISDQDIMAFTQPLSSWLVNSMVHEIGHRYWFKGMGSEQRLRFQHLIKLPKTVKQPSLVPFSKAMDVMDKIDGFAKTVKAILKKFISTRMTFYPKILKAFDTPLFEAGRDFHRNLTDVLQELGVRYNSKLDASREMVFTAGSGFFRRMSEAPEFLNRQMSTYMASDTGDTLTQEALAAEFKRQQKIWVADTLRQLDDVVDVAYGYAGFAVRTHNEEEEAEYTNRLNAIPGGEIEPVSDYGQSNIVEAFAEAFVYYLMGNSMSYDQKESFKSVLTRTADLTPPLGGGPCRVVDRILKTVRDPRLRNTMVEEVEGGHSLPNFEARKVYQFETEKGSAFKSFSITPHAQYRMDLRGITVKDVAQALDSFAARLVSVKGTPAFEWYMKQETITWMDPRTRLEVAFGMGDGNLNIITTYWKGKKDPPPTNCRVERVAGRYLTASFC